MFIFIYIIWYYKAFDFYRVSLSVLNNNFKIGMFESRSVLRHFSLQQIQPRFHLSLHVIQIIIQSASNALHMLLFLKGGYELYVNETFLHHLRQYMLFWVSFISDRCNAPFFVESVEGQSVQGPIRKRIGSHKLILLMSLKQKFQLMWQF